MAITAATAWEIQTGGSSTNGGLFDPSFGGTDYSQQTAAQATGTVTSSTTTVTATTSIFTTAMVGNGITDGTTWVQITAFTSATVVTVDSAPSWTAASIKVGGAVNLPSVISGKPVAGNTIYIKSGTYTLTATQTVTFTGTQSLPIKIVGYTTNRTPYNTDTKPLFTSATTSVTLFSMNACASVWWYNLRVTSTAATRGNGWTAVTTASTNLRWINCEADGTLNGWLDSAGATFWLVGYWENCSARNCTSMGISIPNNSAGTYYLYGCWFDTCTVSGFNSSSTAAHKITLENCASTNNSGAGYSFGNSTVGMTLTMINCIGAGNTGAGTDFPSLTTGVMGFTWINNIMYGNGTYGLKSLTAGILDQGMYNRNNAYGANTTAAMLNVSAGQGDVALTATPFTSSGTGDYSLNTTAGGGALIRTTGFPTVIGSSNVNVATNYAAIGAAQPQSSSGRVGALSGVFA